LQKNKTTCMRKCSTSLAIREIQLKTTLRLYLIQSEWQSRKQTANAGKDVGRLCVGKWRGHTPFHLSAPARNVN
jgi:hypothetical protein